MASKKEKKLKQKIADLEAERHFALFANEHYRQVNVRLLKQRNLGTARQDAMAEMTVALREAMNYQYEANGLLFEIIEAG